MLLQTSSILGSSRRPSLKVKAIGSVCFLLLFFKIMSPFPLPSLRFPRKCLLQLKGISPPSSWSPTHQFLHRRDLTASSSFFFHSSFSTQNLLLMAPYPKPKYILYFSPISKTFQWFPSPQKIKHKFPLLCKVFFLSLFLYMTFSHFFPAQLLEGKDLNFCHTSLDICKWYLSNPRPSSDKVFAVQQALLQNLCQLLPNLMSPCLRFLNF